MRKLFLSALFLLCAAACLGTACALAHAQQSTSATYGAWILQCATMSKPKGHKVCEIEQLTRLKGKNIPFSRIVIAQPKKNHEVDVFVQVPVNVSFTSAVRLRRSKSDTGLAAPFDHCVPAGCFANFVLKDAAVRKLIDAHGVGTISFANAARRQVVIPLSFKGFPEAFRALSKE